MSSSWVLAITVLVTALGVAYVAGRLITLRAGMLKASEDAATLNPEVISGLGISATGPTVLHFSAEWCGPCAGVRRVVDQVCAELPEVAHVEIDMDTNPEAARQLSVLSLPTTFIFDATGRIRFRTHGVPKSADLKSALEALLA
jgi:thiol-disulfide isomerase/thioredoxin